MISVILVGCATPDHDAYDLSPSQIDAIDLLLQDTPGRSLMTTSDNQNPFLDKYQNQEVGYEPYLALGDFNHDGQEDFVVVTTDGDSAYVYLFAKSEFGYAGAQWVSSSSWMTEGGLFVRSAFPKPGHNLGIGSFFSDDVFWFYWNEQESLLWPVPADSVFEGDA